MPAMQGEGDMFNHSPLTTRRPAQTALIVWQPQLSFLPSLTHPRPVESSSSEDKVSIDSSPLFTFNPHFLTLINSTLDLPLTLSIPDPSFAPADNQETSVDIATQSIAIVSKVNIADEADSEGEGSDLNDTAQGVLSTNHHSSIKTTSAVIPSSDHNLISVLDETIKKPTEATEDVKAIQVEEEEDHTESEQQHHLTPLPSPPVESNDRFVTTDHQKAPLSNSLDVVQPESFDHSEPIQLDEPEQPVEGDKEDKRSIASFDSLASFCSQPEVKTTLGKMQVEATPPPRFVRVASPRAETYEPISSPPTPTKNMPNLFARRSSSIHIPSSPPEIPPPSYSSPAHRIPQSAYFSPQVVVPPAHQDKRPLMAHHFNSPYFVAPPPVRPPSSASDPSSQSSKVSKSGSDKVDEDEDTAKMDQWKVGKRPGFQGSFVKQDSVEEEGGKRKRSLNESIHNSAERVLKRPFRAPKVVLAKKNPNSMANQSQSSQPDSSSPPVASRGGNHSISISKSSQPQTVQSNRRNLNKPFKTPTRVNTQFTPPSSTSQRSTSNTSSKSHKTPVPARPRVTLAAAKDKPKTESDKDRINKLEQRERMLREALKYINNPEEEEQVAESIEKWLTVGREIVMRLFKLAPKPDDLDQAQARLNPFQGGGGASFGYDMAGEYPTVRYASLSEEQLEFLKTVDRNEEGEPVDAEGNLLMGDVDVGGFGALPPREETDYGSSYGRRGMSSTSSKARVEVEPPEWSPALMLSQMGVDPTMLGWNAEMEDWD